MHNKSTIQADFVYSTFNTANNILLIYGVQCSANEPFPLICTQHDTSKL